ncbi:MAG: hypothetical protein AB7F32_12690 [Victivallaceae bacterium]
MKPSGPKRFKALLQVPRARHLRIALLLLAALLSLTGCNSGREAVKPDGREFFALYGTNNAKKSYIMILISLERNTFYFYSQIEFFSRPYVEKDGVITVTNPPNGFKGSYRVDNEDNRRIIKTTSIAGWPFTQDSQYVPIDEKTAFEQIGKWEEISRQRSQPKGKAVTP